MSGRNGTGQVSTHTLVEAGDVLRTLNPPIVASLLYLLDDTTYTQEEIANNIGSSRSSVSQYQQSLSTLPLPLATKQGYRYEITPSGEKIVGFLGEMGSRLGVDLYELEWQSDAAHEKVAALLTPLYDSRISMPFFVLDTIRERSTEGDRVDLLSTPQQISIQTIIQDVDSRQKDRGERATSSQVRQVMNRFAEKDTIELNEDRVKLTEKGQEHAFLLERVVKLIEDQSNDVREVDDQDATISKTGGRSDETQTEQRTTGPDEERQRSPSLTQQIHPHGFLGSRSQSLPTNQPDDDESVVLVPAYCLDQFGEEGTSKDSPSTPQPVLPLSPRTVGELSKRVEQLVQEYDEDTRLAMYWMLQPSDKMSPAETLPSSTDSTDSENS